MSDGQSIYAIDRGNPAAVPLASLTDFVEGLPRLALAPRSDSLNGRAITYRDVIYLDHGRLYLLQGRSDSGVAPAPRQLSSLSGITLICDDWHLAPSPDGLTQATALSLPDSDGLCISSNEYLITTTMGQTDAPLLQPKDWRDDIAIIRNKSNGDIQVTGYLGIRNGNLLRLDTAHAAVTTLKSGVSRISGNYFNDPQHVANENLMFFNIVATDNSWDMHLLNLDDNSVSGPLGHNVDLRVMSGAYIYGLGFSNDLSQTTAYRIKTDGSTAYDLGCPVTGDNHANIMQPLSNGKIPFVSAALTELDISGGSCTSHVITSNLSEDRAVISINDRLLFRENSPLIIHDYNSSNGHDSTVANSAWIGVLFNQNTSDVTPAYSLQISNLDLGEGNTVRLESYALDDSQRRLLGTLPLDSYQFISAFYDGSGHSKGIGVTQIYDNNNIRQSYLYSYDPQQAGSLQILKSAGFLEQLNL